MHLSYLYTSKSFLNLKENENGFIEEALNYTLYTVERHSLVEPSYALVKYHILSEKDNHVGICTITTYLREIPLTLACKPL